jgi:exodeoxyribonuclease-5
MKLTKQQTEAIDTVCSWFQYRNGLSYFRLGGLAGTGKTSIILEIIEKLSLSIERVAFAAYTGMAAKVMQKKNIPATTLHKLIYKPVEVKKKITFVKNQSLPENIRLIVVDEASMVSEEIHKDLLSFGIPILYVGDFRQLPPIQKDFNLMEEKGLNYRLTEIHRQAENNPIIRLSLDIREGNRIVKKDNWDGIIGIFSPKKGKEILLRADQVITGKNETRHYLNKLSRKTLGYDADDCIGVGEKIIVLQNNYPLGVVNGEIFEAASASKVSGAYHNLEVMSIDNVDAGFLKAIEIAENKEKIKKGESVGSFAMGDLINPYFRKITFMFDDGIFRDRSIIIGDYAYAITVYKAQGSSWNNILLWDDGFGTWDSDLRKRWLYTSVTRSSEKFVWVQDY